LRHGVFQKSDELDKRVSQAIELESQVIQCKTGDMITETVYSISSCDPKLTSAKHLLKWTQNYRGIENSLHYHRDTTLREDGTLIPSSKLAQIIAASTISL